jgi:hypothetical protein
MLLNMVRGGGNSGYDSSPECTKQESGGDVNNK